MTTRHVFIIGSSLEEERPEINFEIAENSSCVDWLRTSQILDGKLDVSEYETPRLIVHEPDATNWDFFRCSGTFGIMSKRAVAVLGPFGTGCFDFLPALINEQPYCLLRQVGSMDVLDREHTVGKMFPHDPTRFMRITRFAFRKPEISDPCIFVVPDTGYRIFGTDSIEGVIRSNNFRGFRLVDSEIESK